MSCCPFCSKTPAFFRKVDGVDYFDCAECDFIFADPEFLARTDQGGASREYKDDYWKAEIASARSRSFGPSLARFAEAILYCRIPIKRTIDIGTGPGLLLSALQYHLPASAHKFFGVEAFPPPADVRPKLAHQQNYVIGFAGDLEGKFELGTCIEVLEHLTPNMARELARQMRKISIPGSLFIFNTGLTEYVRNGDDVNYLDPLRRGHITSWSVRSVAKVFGPEGFRVHPLEGKRWAFVVEYEGDPSRLLERIWTCHPINKAILEDPITGSLLYMVGLDAARASAFEHRLKMSQAQQ